MSRARTAEGRIRGESTLPGRKSSLQSGNTPKFRFVQSQRRVLFSRMSSLQDTQNQPDERRLPIDRVGVKDLRYPIQIRDKDHSVQSTVATVQLTVDLPHHFKGTHMSRFIEALNSHGRMLHVDNIRDVLEQLTKRLESECAHVDFEFPFFLEKQAPETKSTGLMDYLARFNATMEKGHVEFIVTAIVPVTTLCLLYTSPSPRDRQKSRMPSSA